MAPRKKTRLPSRAASTPSADAGDLPAGGTETSPQPGGGKNTIILDAWTDEQETALLKSVISWKPVGMHKHFRMIAILENLRSHGHTSPTDDHTKPSGVWKKLGELYNLEALDQREDGFGYPVLNDVTKEPYVDFDLPDEEYSDMIFARRLAPAGTSSPPALPFQMSRGTAAQAGRRNSTVDDSEDPRSSPASMKGQRGGRGGRGNRPSKLAESSRPRRSGQGSIEPSGEEEEGNDDPMDGVEDAGKTRRSGRKR